MEYYIVILLLLMVLFGVLGGIVNYFYDSTDSRKKVFKVIDYKLLKSIFTGVVASLLVPLFLNMISSDIIKEGEDDETKLLVFCGFCLIASISSKGFIQTLSSKLLDKINEVQNNVQAVKTEVSPLIQKHTEPDDIDEIQNQASNNCANTLSASSYYEETDTPTTKILKSLTYSQYTYRSIKGICMDTKLDTDQVTKTIKSLITKDLVAENTEQSDAKYYITEKGRKQIQN